MHRHGLKIVILPKICPAWDNVVIAGLTQVVNSRNMLVTFRISSSSHHLDIKYTPLQGSECAVNLWQTFVRLPPPQGLQRRWFLRQLVLEILTRVYRSDCRMSKVHYTITQVVK